MGRMSVRLYLVLVLAVGCAILLTVIVLFKTNLLLRSYSAFILLGGAATLGLLFGARRRGKYRAGVVLQGVGMLMAIAGAAGTRLGVPDSIASAMSLSAVLFFFLASRRLISAVRQSDPEAGDHGEKPRDSSASTKL